MNPALFRKLIEKKLITQETQVAIEYASYENLKKVKTTKGLYSVVRMYADALLPGTFIEVKNESETVSVQAGNIKLIAGKTPVKLAAEHGIRPDGKEDDAPKRRGRKPKVRVVEAEYTDEDFA